MKYTNIPGEYYFKELTQNVLKILLIPMSKAFIEVVFSFIANVKEKQRNTLHFKSTLEAILRVILNCIINKEYCKNFPVTSKMNNYLSKDMY